MKNKKKKEICENCKWRGSNDRGASYLGECWRYPQKYDRADNDFCGEFKKRK